MARRLKKGEKPEVLVRVVKFMIQPTEEQLAVLQLVSDNLWFIWNEKLQERMEFWNNELKPLYEKFKDASDEQSKAIREQLKQVYGHAPVNYIPGQPERSQRNWLTKMREARADFAAVPCAWQQETLVTLEGAFDSFMKLRKNGDKTARPPREKNEHSFCEIQGLLSWQLQIGKQESEIAGGTVFHSVGKINPQQEVTQAQRDLLMRAEEVQIVLSSGKRLYGGPELSFAIPTYQRMVLASAVKLNKFTLYRDKKKGFWISIAYAIPKPAMVEVKEREKVFLALGASSIGVSAPDRSYTINLWRPDKHWMPKIEALRERLKSCIKGSRTWRRRSDAISSMYEKMRLQTLQNHREVIARELKQHGVHFVIVAHSPIRGKKGALADASKPERGGTLGLNWSVQNTGSLAQLRQLLEQKVAEWGGSVEVRLLKESPPQGGFKNLQKARRATALRAQEVVVK